MRITYGVFFGRFFGWRRHSTWGLSSTSRPSVDHFRGVLFAKGTGASEKGSGWLYRGLVRERNYVEPEVVHGFIKSAFDLCMRTTSSLLIKKMGPIRRLDPALWRSATFRTMARLDRLSARFGAMRCGPPLNLAISSRQCKRRTYKERGTHRVPP
jgi:hypothetical protein